MFGGLRLVLALMVMIGHLVGQHDFEHFGCYAVRGFFILSGFLMTSGLNEIYNFEARRFWTNRLLRLLPSYYVVCLLTLLALIVAPISAAQFAPYWHPDMVRDAITNVFLLPLDHAEPHYRLVPPSWSLAIEIEMYLLLFVFVARRENYALIGLGLGVLYHACCIRALACSLCCYGSQMCWRADTSWETHIPTAPATILAWDYLLSPSPVLLRPKLLRSSGNWMEHSVKSLIRSFCCTGSPVL